MNEAITLRVPIAAATTMTASSLARRSQRANSRIR